MQSSLLNLTPHQIEHKKLEIPLKVYKNLHEGNKTLKSLAQEFQKSKSTLHINALDLTALCQRNLTGGAFLFFLVQYACGARLPASARQSHQ